MQQWFTLVLQVVGVDTTPGSSRAAVASTLLANRLSDNAIMESADWASIRTMYHIYLCILPGEPLQGGGGQCSWEPFNSG